MPVMDGVGVARTIRSWELLQELEPTPIIALTTLSSEIASPSDLIQEFTDYLVKPFGQDQLLGLIRRHAGDTTFYPRNRSSLSRGVCRALNIRDVGCSSQLRQCGVAMRKPRAETAAYGAASSGCLTGNGALRTIAEKS